ncbi:MAG: rhomboid family intramembrane serine protease [Pirellulales bacterium]|nr:rhomboid family intramembrane serine protease [Pirellulales bacterium]
MGIYDRDYYRTTPPAPGYSSLRPRSVVVALIVVNVAVWIVDEVFFSGALREYMAVYVTAADGPTASRDTLRHPWLWWQLLTAAFAHSRELQHILFNMLVLFFLGRDIEYRYGPKEFLWLYLATAVFASAVWAGINEFNPPPLPNPWYSMIGASGAISGIVVLYALNFPHRQLLLFFVIPMPAWVAGALCVLLDMYGAIGQPDSNVAFSAHLAGAAFALIYYWRGWNFGRMAGGPVAWLRNTFGGRPRLKVHQPERDEEADISGEVDRVLEKISRQGEASLTAKERRILEKASREYQRRGRGGK